MAYINNKKVLQVVKSAGGGESSTLITTTTDATLVSGSTYELALTYLTETPKVNDFIAYVDSGAITTLYKVTAVDSTNATLTKIGDIGGGGGQLYQHNISFKDTSNTEFYAQIINSNPNAMFTDDASVCTYLNDATKCPLGKIACFGFVKIGGGSNSAANFVRAHPSFPTTTIQVARLDGTFWQVGQCYFVSDDVIAL